MNRLPQLIIIEIGTAGAQPEKLAASIHGIGTIGNCVTEFLQAAGWC
jgi:hypothetical protein